MAVPGVAVLALLLAACGPAKDGATQVAAKVNKEEISVHQINYALQQQRGLKPEAAEAASRQLLDRLIDQELARQRAEEMKLDRDPRVLQQLEAARREIIARAWAEKVGEAAERPTADEVKRYYDEHPELFAARRIYSLQELVVEAKPEQVEALRTQLRASKSVNDFIEQLKSQGLRFAGNQAVKPAEQLPLPVLAEVSKLKDGQAVLLPNPAGAQVLVLAGSRTEPVDEARARPAIEQFLLAEAKRQRVAADLQRIRTAADIEYVGQFAKGAPPAAAPVDAAAAITEAPPAASPASSAAVTATTGTTSKSNEAAQTAPGELSAEQISKGMGLKR